jgi:hypothetical protein
MFSLSNGFNLITAYFFLVCIRVISWLLFKIFNCWINLFKGIAKLWLTCPKAETSEMCEMRFQLIRCYYSCLSQSFPHSYENHVRPLLTSGVADSQDLGKMYGSSQNLFGKNKYSVFLEKFINNLWKKNFHLYGCFSI